MQILVVFWQARRQISGLLKEGKASIRQGNGQHALELLRQVCLTPSLIQATNQCLSFLGVKYVLP